MPPRKRKASRQASSSHDQSEREDSSSSTELNSDIPYDVLKEKGAKRLKGFSETFSKQMRKIEKVMESLFNYVEKLEGRMDERMRTQEERMRLEMRAQLGAQEERIRKEMETLTRKVQECERGWQDRLLKLKDGLRNAIDTSIDKTFENEIDPNKQEC